MFETNDPSKAVEQAQLDKAMRDYLARGGEVLKLPVGAMAETTARQRINPTVIRREKKPERPRLPRIARMSQPAPRRPRLRKPEERKIRERNGPVVGRPGTRTGEILEILKDGTPRTAREIAESKGWNAFVVQTQLNQLFHRKVLKRGELKRIPGKRPAQSWVAA